KAIKLNRPCVVNLSLGSQYDLHNGTGLKAEAYKQLNKLKPEGSVIVAAAGNDGASNRVWGGFDVSEQYTYYYGNPIELAMAIPDSAMENLSFKVTSYLAEYDWENNVFKNIEELGSFQSVVPSNLKNDSIYSELKYKDESIAGSLTAKLNNDPVESDENFVILTINDHAEINVNKNPPIFEKMEVYKVTVIGKGKFFSWLQSVPTVVNGTIVRSVPDPIRVGLDSTETWVGPRSDYSIIAPSLYESTFSVGASVNRWVYEDTAGNRQPKPWNRESPGSLASFSSKGPSVDKRILPEIVAPGMHIFSAIPSYYRGWSPRVLNGQYASMSGTSMSTPCVAGAIALFMEKNPNANLDTIRAKFLSNTVEDDFTAYNGDLPNNYWGYGKLDIFKVMSNGIFFGTEQPKIDFQLYPNPAQHQVFTNLQYKKVELFDFSGRHVKTFSANQPLNVTNLAKGTYVVKVQTANQVIQSLLLVN
ncbi:MAG: S8 family peptidase, partial [Bacteroidetes bacterium]|nr:S8 family peptidase [Bacteroidota bacterium]